MKTFSQYDKLLAYIPEILRNKYAAAIAIFLLFVGFIDSDNFIRRFKLNREISYLEHQQTQLQAQIDEARAFNKQLNVTRDFELSEKLAREKYFMKRDNEVIFYINDED
ncbi:MAG: septum formation initiator family protein [Chitinophagales bacterium]|nr:septum formation initiator family protein [Bacteroidota bacterium]MCB9043586.1 septum formation initiator family protein [Chitinophagales bacterium]